MRLQIARTYLKIGQSLSTSYKCRMIRPERFGMGAHSASFSGREHFRSSPWPLPADENIIELAKRMEPIFTGYARYTHFVELPLAWWTTVGKPAKWGSLYCQ